MEGKANKKTNMLKIPYICVRIITVIIAALLFFPSLSPVSFIRQSGQAKVKPTSSLFTSAISYSKLTENLGRAFDKGWLNETFFVLLFIACMVVLIGLIFVGIGVCMSLGNLKMKKAGNRSLFGGSIGFFVGVAAVTILYFVINATMDADKIVTIFPVGMPIFIIAAVLLLVCSIYVFVATPKPEVNDKMEMESKYKLFLMLLPFLLLVFAFSYLPLFSWRYAFFDYSAGGELSSENFVGFKWFLLLIQNPAYTARLLRVLRNTLVMSGLGIITSWVPMAFAIFLTEVKSRKFKKFVQLFSTVPNFISWVLVYAIAFAIFNTDGFINVLINSVGSFICGAIYMLFKPGGIFEALNSIGFIDAIIDCGGKFTEINTNYLMSTDFMWIKMLLWGMWKGTGWSAIIYISGISGIDQQLYEAATVDGAGRFQKMRHITIPGLLPTFVVMLVMSIAGILSNGMDQYLVFTNANNKDIIEVLDLYVYNIGINSGLIPLSTVVGMTKSIISVILLFVANKVSKLIRGENVV